MPLNAAAFLLAMPLVLGAPQDQKQTSEPPPTPPKVDTDVFPKDARDDLLMSLIAEVDELKAQLLAMRHELAEEQLKRAEAERERDELRQFIQDNREYGDDYLQYQQVREIAEREARRKLAEENRARYERLQEERRARRQAARAERDADKAEEDRLAPYARAGFRPLGLDVFIGRVGFFYGTETSGVRVEYEPIIGSFFYEPALSSRIDYSKMTISGSVLNASAEVRNLGIAIAFFDRKGNQVGAETIQVNNARPNVPYPFTSTISMALDGPFATSSSWVLYADPVEGE